MHSRGSVILLGIYRSVEAVENYGKEETWLQE